MIYRLLFKDKSVIIQGDYDRGIAVFVDLHRCIVYRNRSMGFNILNTCKLCLHEAKAVLLQMATFNVDFGSTGGLDTYQPQGFSRHELSMVRSVTLRGLNKYRFSENMVLSAMKNVVKLTMYYGYQDTIFWRHENWINPLLDVHSSFGSLHMEPGHAQNLAATYEEESRDAGGSDSEPRISRWSPTPTHHSGKSTAVQARGTMLILARSFMLSC